MGNELILEANKRNIVGKAARKLRASGVIPGVLYGRGIDAVSLSVAQKDFTRLFKTAGENTVLKLALVDSSGERDVRDVLIHDVSIDALNGSVLHVDFYQVRMDEVVRVEVPIEIKGESPAVKNEGGILVKALQEVEVEALPGKIPESIDIDVSSLVAFDEAIHVRDLPTSGEYVIITDMDLIVVTVQPPRTEAELKSLEQASDSAAPTPMTEAEAKKKAMEVSAGAEGVNNKP